jgi:hypothetical protein
MTDFFTGFVFGALLIWPYVCFELKKHNYNQLAFRGELKNFYEQNNTLYILFEKLLTALEREEIIAVEEAK